METIRNKKNKEIALEICGDVTHGKIVIISGNPLYGNEIIIHLVERQGYLEDPTKLLLDCFEVATLGGRADQIESLLAQIKGDHG